MSGSTISVSTQWALHGKAPDAEGYRVLACSTGDLSKGNFEDALGRFALGALDTLPQVSVSWAQQGTRPGTGYLALAIHWFAGENQRYADGILQFDDHGRSTAFTSYFCAPYRELAESAITYQDMYNALRAVALPVTGGPPKDVTITASPPPIVVTDDLALRVAPLLLTGAPVCVLGAEHTSVSDRLRFIDTVMSLLPYGLRAKMAAATWTRATNREHRFRLFFSSAPRGSDEPDHVAVWGEPDMVPVPGGPAGEYFDWLADKAKPLNRLPELITELGFGPKASIQVLEMIDDTTEAPTVAAASSAVTVVAPRPAGAGRETDFGASTLKECAGHLKVMNLSRLRSDISRLAKYAETADLHERDRVRYRKLIQENDLLRHNYMNDKYEGKLYDALLPLAFGSPLRYDGYCQVVVCLGNEPHEELLKAIRRSGMADHIVKAIVLSRLDTKDLGKWLDSDDADPVRMINSLSREKLRRDHARFLCDATVYYLDAARKRYHPEHVRAALRQHGFLAHVLQLREDDDQQYQVETLHAFLRAAYPGPLDGRAIAEVLTGTPHPPTPALFAAVLIRLANPADAWLAMEAYAKGSLSLLKLDPKTRVLFERRIPELWPDTVRRAQP